MTQTLHLIYDMHAAVAEMYRALKPGGVLLLTCPGISQVDRGDGAQPGFGRSPGLRLSACSPTVFGAANVAVEARGNVYAAVCFLEGWRLKRWTLPS